MKRIHRDVRGFALATAILALVVVGALVTAGFFAASQEGRIGTSNAQADLAFYVAEQGLQNTLGTVKKRQLRNLTAGSTLDRTGTVAVEGRTVGTYTATIRPFGGEFYFVESVGTVTQGGRYAGATRRIGSVVRTRELRFPMTAALTTYGGINLRGNALISGTDSHPEAWADSLCDDPVPTESGIRTTMTAEIGESGSPTITGDPRIERDPTLEPTDFEDFGDVNINDLIGDATHILPGGTYTPEPSWVGGDPNICDKSDTENWGDPSPPDNDCSTYFPTIYSRGNLSVGGGAVGQGILVVEGDLSVTGHFEFYGVVIVTGVFNNNRGSGNAEIHGTLLTKNNADIEDDSEFRGTPVLQFSTCSAERAIEENDAFARLFPVAKRSWVDLTAAGVQD